MAIFTFTPDSGAQRKVSARVNKNQFGGGYTQRVPEGVNSLNESWSLTFSLRTKSEIQAIDAFLSSCLGATPFTWTTPNGDTISATCESWDPVYQTDYDCSLTATFERNF